MDILPLIILYVEVLFLAFAEKKLWNTWFTPLNCLAVPYAVALTVCLCVNGNLSFVPFYYPSVWVWVVGLAVFFVPSCILACLQKRRSDKGFEPARTKDFRVSPSTFRILEYITWGIFALFVFWFIRLAFIKNLQPGGESFAQEWAGHGFFGHLFTVLMGLNIFWMFAADKNHKRYWLYVLGFLVVALLYLVKGWFLVPMAAGFLLRLLTGRTKFGIRAILVSVFTGLAFFFASYWMLLYVAVREKPEIPESLVQQSDYKKITATFISYHALAYVTSGVYGLSEDLAQNTLEDQSPDVIYAPFINIWRFLGDKDYVSSINNQYVETTSHYHFRSNVRSFFGTLYVFLGSWHAIAYAFVFSGLVYLLFAFAIKRRQTFALIIVGWIMGCLSMGWFDPYSITLNFISIPGFLMAIFGFCYAWEHRREIAGKIKGIKWLSWRYIRRLLALLQVIDLSLLLLFFWTPWRLPSYFLGVGAGIAFAFVLTVPRRAINFRFLKPYLAFLLSYLLLAISISYSSDTAFATVSVLRQTILILVPFVFWGMTPRFFSPGRIHFFAFCFVVGSVFLFVVKITQLAYCYSIFEPYYMARYPHASLLNAINEFLSFQNVFFGWFRIHPIMHTTVEALVFNLAFSLVFIAYVQKHPWLDSHLKKCVAVFVMLLFAFVQITSNSKTGQFMFLVSLIILLVFAFRKKRWGMACGWSAFLLLLGTVGFLYFGTGILGRFNNSVRVIKEMENHEKVISDGSLLPRIYCWNTAVEMAKEKPVFGFGASSRKDFIDSFSNRYPSFPKVYHHSHNQFLSVLVSNGWVGLLVFLLFWVQAVHLVWKNRRLWGWLWLLSFFAFCCIDVPLRNIALLYICLPYCFLMVEYYNRQKVITSGKVLPEKPECL